MEETKINDGRIPPQDLEAEKSLLGALLLSDAAFPNVLERIQAKDFYDPRHVDIFKGMTSLYAQHRPIDLMTVTSELKAQKNPQKNRWRALPHRTYKFRSNLFPY